MTLNSLLGKWFISASVSFSGAFSFPPSGKYSSCLFFVPDSLIYFCVLGTWVTLLSLREGASCRCSVEFSDTLSSAHQLVLQGSPPCGHCSPCVAMRPLLWGFWWEGLPRPGWLPVCWWSEPGPSTSGCESRGSWVCADPQVDRWAPDANSLENGMQSNAHLYQGSHGRENFQKWLPPVSVSPGQAPVASCLSGSLSKMS